MPGQFKTSVLASALRVVLSVSFVTFSTCVLAENSSDVVWLFDLQRLRFIYVSPSVHRLLGNTPEEMAAHPFYSAKAMRDNLLIGDAAEVIEKLKKIEALGYDEFSFWIDSGMSFARKRDGLRRLIDDVMPAFA